jgi:hypothetical protein
MPGRMRGTEDIYGTVIGAPRLIDRFGSERLGRRVVVNDHEKIDVAFWPCLAAGRRTKQDDSLWMEMRDNPIEQLRRDDPCRHAQS